ncbi:MAG: InlB B-repeat-containing protein [Lachnospiraceae bacterium]|nr:InlB B-repeat-containing protein [Lachnospiraceae bacterium]
MKNGTIQKRRKQFLAALLAWLLVLQSFSPMTALAASYSGNIVSGSLGLNDFEGVLLVSGDTITVSGADYVAFQNFDPGFVLNNPDSDNDSIEKYSASGPVTVIGVSSESTKINQFAGWIYSGYEGSGDMAVFALVEKDECNAILVTNNGEEGGEFNGPFINGQLVPTVSLPQRTGYVFDGFYVNGQQIIDGQGQWKVVEIKDSEDEVLWWISKTEQKYYFHKRDGVTQAQLSTINMEAHWTPITYRIAFDGNGAPNTMGSMTGLKYDAEYSISANTLTKNYYDFDGWKVQGTDTIYEDQATIKNLTTVNNATVKLQAQWKKKDYTITLDPAGGSFSDTTFAEVGTTGTYQRKYQVDNASFTLPAPTKTECQFLGWKLGDADPVSNVTINTSAPENRTYTAIWKTNQYSVTFKDENGNVLKAAKLYDYNTPAASIEKPADPTKTSTPENTYTFDKWTPEITDVTGDATYTATYTATKNKYNVIWKDEDGKVLETKEYEYGTLPADIEKPANPTKDRTDEYTYTFNGWTPEIAQVTGEATYTATYKEEKNKYKVTWVNEGQTIAEKLYDYGTVSGNIVKPDNPTKAATPEYTYTFDKWTPEITDVTGAATYTATYTAQKNKYTVTWKDADGTVLISNELEYGTPVDKLGKPADPSKEATPEYTYTFKGWDKEPAMVTGDATYTATYTATKNKYDITWKDENDNIIRTDSVEYGTAAGSLSQPKAPEKEPTVEYVYPFAGWTPALTNVTGAATYKATYKQENRKYSIKWIDGNGKTIKDDAVEYGTVSGNLVVPENPAKDATAEYSYTFTGWEPALTDVTKDAEYTAVFTQEKNKYEVKWVDGDGKTLKTETLEYGATPEYDGQTPTKSADADYEYTFDGKWSPQVGKVTGNTTYTATFAQKAVNKSGATNDQDTGKDTEQKGEDPFLDTDDKEADVKGTEFGVLFPGCGKVTATSIELKWKKVDEADAYYIYGSMCNHANRKYTYKRLATITDKNQTRWTAKKLKKKSYYKFYIVAVRYVNGEEVLVSKSKRLHITTLNPTYGDATGLKVTAPKKVKVRKGNKYLKTEVLKDGYTIILKHGQTIKIKAKEYNKDKKIKHHKTIGFESSKPSVAVLSQIKRTENYRYMKIRGGKRGKCKLYIYAQNGKYITLNIVVR